MRTSPFILLCATGLFAIFSSTISKSPVLPLFASHLGADPSGIGFVASVSAFTGIVASIPAGLLSDRLGRKRMLIFSLFVFSTAPFLYLFVGNIWQLAAVRFYHGFATAIFIPVAMALVADLFHTERGEKMGWFSTSTLLGRFMSPMAGGVIIGMLVLNPSLSYKAVYLTCGVAGIIALLLALKLPTPEKATENPSWIGTFSAFKSVVSDRGIVIISGVEAAMLFAYGTFETFLPLYSMKSGLSAYHVGIFLSSQVITLALTKPVMGRFSDRHGRMPQILAGTVFGALCMGSFSLFRSFLPLLALSIAFGLCLSVVTSATSAFIADSSRKESHGSAMGILGSIMDVGHTAGPLVSGIIAAYFGYGKSFVGAAAVLILAAVVYGIYALRIRRPAAP
ncbi:MAG: MFS transporter [Thermodesulfovibrionales bacterium]|nr:MFS transporter [Thermodesulfovibrionales bacterium]